MENGIKNIMTLALALIIAFQPLGALALNKQTINAAAKKTKKIALKATAITAGASLATFLSIIALGRNDYIDDSFFRAALTTAQLSLYALIASPILGSATILTAELVDAATNTNTTKQSIINKIAQFMKRGSLAVIIPAVAIAPGFLNRLIKYGVERVTDWEKALIVVLIASPAVILLGEAIDEYTHKELPAQGDTVVPA